MHAGHKADPEPPAMPPATLIGALIAGAALWALIYRLATGATT